MTITHSELCLIAEKFLVKNGFGVVFHDKFKASTTSGEQPDCLGFRNRVSCLIENEIVKVEYERYP